MRILSIIIIFINIYLCFINFYLFIDIFLSLC